MCDEVRDEDLTPAERKLAQDLDAISEAKAKLENLQRYFLQQRGWKYTCSIGSLWLWRKGVLAVDIETAIQLESMWPDGIPGLDKARDEVLANG